jgi:hypothetical protein
MEVGARPDGLVVEGDAAGGKDGVEIGDSVEVFVCDGLVEERPKTFCGLKLRTIGWQIDELDTLRDGEIFRAVPSGVVKDQQDDPLASGTGFFGKGGKEFLEQRFVHAIAEIPERLPARRRDESRDVEPFVTVMSRCRRALADRSPDPAMDRLQAEAVLVRRPYFDRRVRMDPLFLGDGGFDLFLKASRSWIVAACG